MNIVDIYKTMLKNPVYWDGNAIQYDEFLADLEQIVFEHFVEEVFFPALKRASHLLQIIAHIPDEEMASFTTDSGETFFVFRDEQIADDLSIRLFGTEILTPTGKRRATYIQRKYELPEWSYYPTIPELMELDVRPNLVPNKKNQPSMF